MTKTSTTKITIIGTMIGAYWWPIGEPWHKDIAETREYRPREQYQTYRTTTGSLRDFILDLTNDGDSSAACLFDAETVVVVTRYRGPRKTARTFPITMFPSVADMVADV